MPIETAQIARRVKPTLITITQNKKDGLPKYIYIHDRIEEKVDSFERPNLTQEEEKEALRWMEIFMDILPEDEECAVMLHSCRRVRKARTT